MRTENLFGARQNHLPSERDDRPDVLVPSAIHLTRKSKNRFDAENAILRHQLIVLERKIRARIRLTPMAIAYPSFGPIVGFPQCGCASDRPARRPGAVAWCRFSTLLALKSRSRIKPPILPNFRDTQGTGWRNGCRRRLIARCRGSFGGLIQ